MPIDDIFQQVFRLSERLRKLEIARPEDIHYVGDTGDPLAPAFVNSWVNYDNGLATPSTPPGRSVGFYKWAGRVWLTGVMKTGASGTVAFVLPSGYRPPYTAGDILTFAGGSTGLVTPEIDGSIIVSTIGGNVSTFVELFNVSFRHA